MYNFQNKIKTKKLIVSKTFDFKLKLSACKPHENFN